MTGHGELFGQSLGPLKPRMFPESVAYQKIADFGLRILDLKETKQEKVKTETKHSQPKTEVLRPEVEKSEIQVPEKEESKIQIPKSKIDDHIVTARKYADSGQYDKAEAECGKAR